MSNRRVSLAVTSPSVTNTDKKLFGRQSELLAITHAFQRMSLLHRPELVLLQGPPGSGKTAMGLSIRSQAFVSDASFVPASFNASTRTLPILAAIDEFICHCEAKALKDEATLEQLSIDVRISARADGEILIEWLPSLHRLLCLPEPDLNASPTLHYGSENFERLRAALPRVMRTLTSCLPLILFLDDLQRADTASMEILRSLLVLDQQDSDEPTFLSPDDIDPTNETMNDNSSEFSTLSNSPEMRCLILGAFQCSKLPDQFGSPCDLMRPLQATLRDLERSDHLQIVRLSLKAMTLDHIRDMLEGILRKPCAELAEIIFARTAGTIPDVLEVLRLLLDLEYFVEDSQVGWQWDQQRIEKDFSSMESIHAVITNALYSLDRLALEVLKIAAIMGDDVDDSALDLVLQICTGQYLQDAAVKGLLLFLPEYGGYRFAHDWVRAAAFDLIAESEREEFYLRVGRKLWKSSTRAAVDKNIFTVVSLLNFGSKLIGEERERYKVSEMNLRAAEKAVAMSALDNAQRYLRKGIQLLGGTRWKDHYQLSLGLYTLAAEVEVSTGHYDRVVGYIEEVVACAVSMEDKVRAYAALIRSMGQQDNLLEATELGVDVLRQMGEILPQPTKFHITGELVRVKLALKRRSLDEILCMGRMRDQYKINCLKILNLVFMYSYQARSLYAALSALRSVMITIDYGLHDASAVAFASYGMMLCGSGMDVWLAQKYGQLAIKIVGKLQAKNAAPVVHLLYGVGIRHWTRPVKEAFDQLMYASRLGVEIGDVETALLARMMKVFNCIYTGHPLTSLDEEIQECLRMSRKHQKQSYEVSNLMLLQCIHCLTGRAPNPGRLSGDMIKYEDLLQFFRESTNLAWLDASYQLSLHLAYLFGDIEMAEKAAIALRERDSSMKAVFTRVDGAYLQALTAVMLVRTGEDTHKNLKYAQTVRRKLRIWSNDSPRNYRHKLLLLDAELLSLKTKRKTSSVMAAYDEALKAARRERFWNAAALVQERAADYLSNVAKDTSNAKIRYERAVELNEKWGATAKVEQLKLRLAKKAITLETHSEISLVELEIDGE